MSCFQNLYGNKQCSGSIQTDAIFCSKKCHQQWILSSDKLCLKLTWTNDGANGPDDPQCSEKILLDWLLTPGNYIHKYKGNGKDRCNKKEIADTIASKMTEAGVKVKRDGKKVINKIQHLERKFKEAHDFCRSQKGERLKLKRPDEFDATVRKICSHYVDLLDIFEHGKPCRQRKVALTHDKNLEHFSSDDSGSHASLRRERSHMDGMDDVIFSEDDPSKGLQVARGRVETVRGKESHKPKKRTSAASGMTSPAKPSKRMKSLKSMVEKDTTSQHIASRTSAKDKVAITHLKQVDSKEKTDEMNEDKHRIDMTMLKVNRLKEVYETFPDMQESDVLNLFPAFRDIIQYVKKPSSRRT